MLARSIHVRPDKVIVAEHCRPLEIGFPEMVGMIQRMFIITKERFYIIERLSYNYFSFLGINAIIDFQPLVTQYSSNPF